MTATIERLRTTLALQMALDSKRRAARITELRERALLTQRGLEEKSGVSERTIQRAEDPNDDIELRYATREKLAKAFGVKPDDLLPEAGTATKGNTPDPFARNGDMPDDLRARLDRIEAEVAAMRKDQRELIDNLRVVLLEEFERGRAALELPKPGQGPASDAPPRGSTRAKGRRATG